MAVNLDVKFRNPEQEKFYFSNHRNGCFSGGFNNGKSFVACQRAVTMLTLFENYRYVIARHKYKTLRSTTMQTFFKVLPRDFVFRHDENMGVTILKNRSLIYWMHLDVFNEDDLKGLEINSVLIDQAEEQIDESPILILDARVGRWDQAQVPENLLAAYPNWPRNDFGIPRVPNFMDILANPNDEIGEHHWIYRDYHPESMARKTNYFYIERATDERLGDPGTMASMKTRDKEWVDTYFEGKWGKSAAQVHNVDPLSIINYDEYSQEVFEKFIELIKSRGAIYRILDHGNTGITCCTWAAAINKVHVFFQEYYIEGNVISFHRQAIYDMSEFMEIAGDLADPDIFKKKAQKDGAYTTVADEYTDTEFTDAPDIMWQPADNAEIATRNRINELLKPSNKYAHPITKISPAPALYWIKRHRNYPVGCFYSIQQTQSQRRLLLGSENGRKIYSIERDPNVVDHAYDTIRYYIAAHNESLKEPARQAPALSFARFNKFTNRLKYSFAHGSSD